MAWAYHANVYKISEQAVWLSNVSTSLTTLFLLSETYMMIGTGLRLFYERICPIVAGLENLAH